MLRRHIAKHLRTTAPRHLLSSSSLRQISTAPSNPPDEELVPDETVFDNIFLRDACTCPSCVDPSSKQKSFSTAQLPTDTYIKSRRAVADPEHCVEITWGASTQPDHVSRYPVSQLKTFGSPVLRFSKHWDFARPEIFWHQKTLKENLVVREYKDYLENEEALDDVVLGLYSSGLAFVKGAPAAEKDADGEIVVEKVARKIGYIKETFYGTSWNVRSIANAKNIAYTSVNLPLHMDLLYYESPPGIQLLHCIENSAQGGESVYADSFRAAYLILERDPAAFFALATFPITFHYDNDGYHYMHTRPLIELDPYYKEGHPSLPRARIKCVNYSPPFQGPFEHMISRSSLEKHTDLTQQGEFRQFLRAYRMFEDIINDRREQYEEKFAPGDIALFMNRRVLHSRREFKVPTDSEQQFGRWLKGTYLDIDSFYSKLRGTSGL
ncbi:taurine catabolism dioxygenase TauD, TfdA family-domain-containing protein [Myxozyma melibiosi]|uniref:Taurine catabolism dioxygenase TauD, TfdA family-domain-containing protein n=1 Tax=Myxozyma melibiosi TaxID=54550 RepID=A0ABR1F594_9ASCO